MSTDRQDTYSYVELAERIEQELGERPSRSALRAAGAKGRRATLARPRLTVNMPAPLPSPSRTAPAAFSVEQVESWLLDHPRRGWNKAMATARERLERGDEVESVITQALAAGLSWRTITGVLNAHDGGHRSTAGVHKRYRHLTVPSQVQHRGGTPTTG